MRYHIEGMKIQYGMLLIKGWAAGMNPGAEIEVSLEAGKQKLEYSVSYRQRLDLLALFSENTERIADHGFRLSYALPEGVQPVLVLTCEGKQTRILIKLEQLQSGSPVSACWEEAGFSNVASKLKLAAKKMLKLGVALPVTKEKEPFLLSATGILSMQQKERLWELKKDAHSMEGGPLFSILVPVYRPVEAHLREMLDSVLGQVYENWELCLADASEDAGRTLAVMEEYAAQDQRIRVLDCRENRGISGNTNKAFSMAQGAFTALLDHDDLLEPDALYEVTKLLQEQPDLDFIYTDSDLADEDAMEFHSPLHKTGWAPETMLSSNYITHFSVIRTEVLRRIGGWRPETDGAQDWDLYFRVCEVTDHVAALPKILYHWRMAATSTAASMEAKPYAREAQRLSIQSHLDRTGRDGRVIWEVEPGRFRVLWEEEPSIQIVAYEEAEQLWKQSTVEYAGKTHPAQVWIFKKETIQLSEAAAAEMAAFAVQSGIAFVMPKLLKADDTIVSVGLRGQFVGADSHASNSFGSGDWYRNPVSVCPDCVAVSCNVIKRFLISGEYPTPEWIEETSEKAVAQGFRNVMTPFAEVIIEG